MKQTNRSREARRPRLQVRFFWQLLAAFSLIVLVAGGGTYAASQLVGSYLPSIDTPVGQSLTLWADRLSRYYQEHGSWAEVTPFIDTYPCGAAWGPWDEGWKPDYTLAASDGTIVASSDSNRIGQSLSGLGWSFSTQIRVNGQQVGILRLVSFRRPTDTAAVPGFLPAVLIIAACSLVISLVLSRGISRPLVQLTAATRALAGGDLSVRVPGRAPGEVGELAAAFNAMAAEMSRSDQLRRNLTADVAHELRTPLSVIRGKLEGVLDGVYPATAEHLVPILEETRLLTHLVEDLQLLTLADTGQLPLEKRPTNVGALLRDAQVNFGPQAEDRGVLLEVQVPADLPAVDADPRRLAQVLANLLTNALRHTPEGGQVTLSAQAGEGAVVVTVADTGTGIPAEELPYIFERFWRGDRSRSRAGGGSGLGLAIARQLVELHGGTIQVESRPGQGSRFWFRLPVAH
jgi:two-component system OmpR family sensor kinase/two-component system sensor histidine kinase BaeS